MRFRSVVALVLAAMGAGAALVLWAVKVPTTPVEAPSQPVAVADVALAEGEYLYEGAKYTRLSSNKPDGLPAIEPYGGLNRGGQAAIPIDTEPAVWSATWTEGLSLEQAKMYAEGMVRSGLEDLGMCKPGYTCHATVGYDVYDQTASPQMVTVQMSFTTPTAHTELFLLAQDGRGKVWGMTDAGWNLIGVVEELPENQRTMIHKLAGCTWLDDMKY